MRTEATTLDETRHRLLEGVLLRLARLPDAGGLVLRGGMLLRHWFGPLPRAALDLDLVAPSPLTVEEVADRYLPLFADSAVADGVAFDNDRIQLEGIWQHTDNPEVRVHVCGAVGEDETDFQVDITGGPLPRPAPVFGELPTACGQSARVWMCRTESVVAQKFQALYHLGMMGWRPKDLNDLRLLLCRVPVNDADLRQAIAAYMADLGGTGSDARALLRAVLLVGHEAVLSPLAGFRQVVAGAGRAEKPGGCQRRGRQPPDPRAGEFAMSGRLPKGLLDAIVADIDDDAPRLICADWLDEHGDSDRAEFIRVQIERARLPAWDAAQVGLRLREQELLKRHGEPWLAEMPAIKGARWEGFRRGIVAEVSFHSFEAMRFSAHDCRAVAPVEAVTVNWPRRREGKLAVRLIAELRELTLTGRPYPDEVARLADSPQLSTLRALTVLGLDADDLSRLVASPQLAGLRALRLVSNGIGSPGVRALTQAATLTALEELDLSGPGYYE